LRIVDVPTTVAPGQNFTVGVEADMTDPDEGFEVFDLYAYSVGIAFDPAAITAQAVTEGNFLAANGSTFFIPGTIDNAVGSISSTLASLETEVPGATGTGLLFSVQFTAALVTGVSSIALVFDPTFDALLNSQLAPLNPPILQGAIVTVAEPTPEPVAEPGTLLLLGLGAGLAAAGRHRISRP
jgi:hypothetical protein